jgi:hypothetical protein
MEGPPALTVPAACSPCSRLLAKGGIGGVSEKVSSMQTSSRFLLPRREELLSAIEWISSSWKWNSHVEVSFGVSLLLYTATLASPSRQVYFRDCGDNHPAKSREKAHQQAPTTYDHLYNKTSYLLAWRHHLISSKI